MGKYVSAQEAVKIIKSNDRIYVQAAAATPTVLTKALTERASELKNVEVCHLHTEGEAAYANPELSESFHVNSFFIGKNVRHTLVAGNGSYTPVFLSELPYLFRKNVVPLDVVFIHVSPPDIHGYCSLGVSVEATLAAIENAKTVIAQVNPKMPRTFGDGILHVSEIDYLVEVDTPIYEHEIGIISSIEDKIGTYIASLIEDESTLQMGIGSIPNAALTKLTNHKNLGLHTEMFSDGVIDLIEKNVINCDYKGISRGRALATFLIGSQRLYDFVNDNPFVEMRESSYVNDTSKIRKNPKMVAINSAIEVDVTGQVCADSIGAKMYSGVGGQMDFIRGASLSNGGKAIIALPSITKNGVSRIVPYLKQGAGVVTTRSHVHYVITENGIADLYGKTLKQRASEMVKIAHPSHQEWIEKSYFEMIN
ncbi:acetyl-CoA hydrolase/transferase family protein [Flavobacterium psychrophilum]|jgi:acyl-CoA hydrolase|uniref:acetyl-CoA hydrolase/transferase family protein n=1 Tax=Flavobacterium psychrophilum TaxID=96345 RepID=UPI0004F8B17E|nr:acetyl-CoA hydrolase/transferase C-terminal domain-containing protein [Flavobacterium psychrophilum]AIN73321.1 4-hydroxybutyrate CoA-transferase [Flavobacterium psychrophilum FPG3]EKT2069674.1 acetyl-CoA hydrolase/transferase family protein [Flavobacterium psychrophilum]EKT2071934.1 acetyl-CoA hydrolase/transferase family protein [Flavobacterium psychrophilum]EKT3957034.1 acetyl-CoA hydrolase/transferase family protein [Flavobacterium psychrophilum]EKT3962921.1 acetyl-CoA hydrolase/transfer